MAAFQRDSRIDKTFPKLTIRKLKKEHAPPYWKTSSDDDKLKYLKDIIIPPKYHEKVACKRIDACINDSLDGLQKYSLSAYTFIRLSYTELLNQVDRFSQETSNDIPREPQHETGDIESSEVTEELRGLIIPDVSDNTVLWKREVDVLLVFFRIINGEPEMFILTSGNARHLIPEDMVDENFPHNVARRILDFNLKSSTFEHLTGPDQSTTTTHKQGEVKDLSLWDVIGSVVTSFEMPLRRNCSLYDILKDKKNEESTVYVNIGGRFKTLQIKKKLSLFDLQEIMHRFSQISRGESTHLTTGVEEKDNEMFDVFDNIREIKSSSKLGKQLNQDILDRLKNNDVSSFTLSHRFTSTWNEASIFKLKHKSRPRQYIEIEQWEGNPPEVSDVMAAIQSEGMTSELGNIYLEFVSTVRESGIQVYRFPLFDFIEGQLDIDGNIYFRYQGKWLEIKSQYLPKVEEMIQNILTEHYIAPDEILPLPWRDTLTKTAKEKRVRPCSYNENSYKLWKKEKTTLDVSREQRESVNFDDFSQRDTRDRLFKRMHCHQTESLYNEGYILLNHTLPSNADGPTGYLLGDRIYVREIELFDILYYTPTETYLIHVKEGFAKTSRDVCSQIHLSADLIFSDIISNSNAGKDILEQFWTSATTDTGSAYTEANKTLFENMTKEIFFDLFLQRNRKIVYILAFRDDHKRSRFDKYSNEFPKALFLKEVQGYIEHVQTVLINTGYLAQNPGNMYITNKIFMKESEAIEQMTAVTPGLSENQAKLSFTLLRQSVCQPPSLITKMELVNLFYHFRKLQITGKKLQLKICSLNKVLAWE